MNSPVSKPLNPPCAPPHAAYVSCPCLINSQSHSKQPHRLTFTFGALLVRHSEEQRRRNPLHRASSDLMAPNLPPRAGVYQRCQIVVPIHLIFSISAPKTVYSASLVIFLLIYCWNGIVLVVSVALAVGKEKKKRCFMYDNLGTQAFTIV